MYDRRVEHHGLEVRLFGDDGCVSSLTRTGPASRRERLDELGVRISPTLRRRCMYARSAITATREQRPVGFPVDVGIHEVDAGRHEKRGAGRSPPLRDTVAASILRCQGCYVDEAGTPARLSQPCTQRLLRPWVSRSRGRADS